MGGDDAAYDAVDELVLEIIAAVGDCTGTTEDFQLHDHVDSEALAALIDSIDGEFSISFAVEGVSFTITEAGIESTSPSV